MLTKDDLKQIEKTTRKVVREEVEAETKNLKDDFSFDLRNTKIDLADRIDSLGSKVKTLEISVNNIQKDVTELKKDTKHINKEMKFQSNFLDKQVAGTQRRVGAIEAHLDLPSPAII